MEDEEFIAQMASLRSLQLPARWRAPLSELQALTQLQHLSLGGQFLALSSDVSQVGAADLTTILFHCPLRSLVVGCPPDDLSEVVWEACPTLEVLELWRGEEWFSSSSSSILGCPSMAALLRSMPSLMLLRVAGVHLSSQQELVGLEAGLADAFAASPALCVEVYRVVVVGVRPSELLDAWDLLRRVQIQELECQNVVFAGWSCEAAALAQMLPGGQSLRFLRCTPHDPVGEALFLRVAEEASPPLFSRVFVNGFEQRWWYLRISSVSLFDLLFPLFCWALLWRFSKLLALLWSCNDFLQRCGDLWRRRALLLGREAPVSHPFGPFGPALEMLVSMIAATTCIFISFRWFFGSGV